MTILKGTKGMTQNYKNDLNSRVVNIKGNNEEKDLLIEEYKPFIAACTERFTKRYVTYGEDDELSISMLAFNEAIEGYSIEQGNFLAFSSYVIKRRLIDYVRRQKVSPGVVALYSPKTAGDKVLLSIENTESLNRYGEEKIKQQRKLEIQEYKSELNEWGITMDDLLTVSPKHYKTRELYKEVVQYILQSPILINEIISKKQLPLALIQKYTGIPRKKLERARKYIIAIIILLTGDYRTLQSYIDWP